ncbi:MAG: LytTR family DNA-binding domain-containing protein [Lachnospiraceae bacterium]
MKLTMEKIMEGEDEVIIRYHEMNDEIETIASVVRTTGKRIEGYEEDRQFLLLPEHIYYFESVDGVTYAYLKDRVCKINDSLERLAIHYESRGMFRCSKSMVINIYKISYLKSESGNRICATMENGEQVMISRRYARILRQILKGDRGDE